METGVLGDELSQRRIPIAGGGPAPFSEHTAAYGERVRGSCVSRFKEAEGKILLHK